MTLITRFAPSPTGRLHVGNIRTALHNALFARANGGRFLLRIDDTDRRALERGLCRGDPRRPRLARARPRRRRPPVRALRPYEREFDRLKAAGRVYACYETPEELDLRRKVLLGRGLPPVYERKPADAPVPDGVAPHWRFRLDHDAPIEWDDLVRGHQKFDPALISDPVVRRADGSWLYLLPSVIDDIDLAITHVVRGEDHVSNSATQIQMFEALGAAPPHFAHEALLVAAEGKLSKRLGSTGIDALREAGIEPLALLSLLARLGTSQPVEARTSLAALAEGFDFRHLRPRPGALRPCRSRAAQRQIAPRDRLSPPSPTASPRAPARPTGPPCAAISPTSARSPTGSPSSTATSPPPKSCQTTSRCSPRPRMSRPRSIGQATPGISSSTRSRPAAGARAAPCSTPCGSRSPATTSGPEMAALSRSSAATARSRASTRRRPLVPGETTRTNLLLATSM